MIFDKEIIDAAKNLKVISTYGVGFDHIDIDYASRKGNCSHTIALIVFCVLLLDPCALTHDYGIGTVVFVITDHALREGVFLNVDEYDRNQGYTIEGKTLGILGMGRIGQQVTARFAKALGMKMIYHNRHQLKPEET